MLKQLLISEVRLKILRLLLLNPGKQYHVRDIGRRVGAEINAVRRELANLSNINLLRHRQGSNRIYYTVDTSHPFYGELLSLIDKEYGLSYLVLKNLKHLGNVDFIMVSTGFIRGRASTPLDVDLFLVGDINLDILEDIVRKYHARTQRDVNYSVMSLMEFKNRKRVNDQFILRVLMQGRTMLVGDEEKFYSVA